MNENELFIHLAVVYLMSSVYDRLIADPEWKLIHDLF